MGEALVLCFGGPFPPGAPTALPMVRAALCTVVRAVKVTGGVAQLSVTVSCVWRGASCVLCG